MRLTLLTCLAVSACFQSRPPVGPTPVRLWVTTSPPTTVTILPLDAKRARVELGRTPLEAVPGAFVHDTVLMVNEANGIRFEEQIEFGRPDELKTIHKTFAREPRDAH
jgi:hypothetical protein